MGKKRKAAVTVSEVTKSKSQVPSGSNRSDMGKKRKLEVTNSKATKKTKIQVPLDVPIQNYNSKCAPSRKANGDLCFDDHPEFKPNMTPKEVLQSGSFGGTYFRDIYSSVLGQKCTNAYRELPEDWLVGLNIPKQVASSEYRESVNTYNVKCGGDLRMWEESGWIKKQDPYGWFQWYCRFYQGRRTKDDERQIGRWSRCAGTTGRWRNNLITKVYKADKRFDDVRVSPVVRQVLQHWAYRLTESHYQERLKIVAKRIIK